MWDRIQGGKSRTRTPPNAAGRFLPCVFCLISANARPVYASPTPSVTHVARRITEFVDISRSKDPLMSIHLAVLSIFHVPRCAPALRPSRAGDEVTVRYLHSRDNSRREGASVSGADEFICRESSPSGFHAHQSKREKLSMKDRRVQIRLDFSCARSTAHLVLELTQSSPYFLVVSDPRRSRKSDHLPW